MGRGVMTKNKKIIKIDILEKFRELEHEADDKLPHNWLVNDYFGRMNTFEKITFDRALAELALSGLVAYKPGDCPEVKLTRLGKNLIFN